MKCQIPGLNLKILGRAIHSMSKIGDELYLESLAHGLVLKTINAAESAYCIVTFGKPFFTYYSYDHLVTDDDAEEPCQCKISMKSALSVFKSPTHMEKQVDMCEIKLDPSSCKLLFQLRCKHGIVKTHFVSIQECRKLGANFTKDTLPNKIFAQHKIFSEVISNFQPSEDQVTFDVNSHTLLLRNYTDSRDAAKKIKTQVSLQSAEFESYSIGVDTNISISLREFRAVLSFAETLNLPVSVLFDTTGKPAVFVIENNTTFEANFLIATEPPDIIGTQQTASTTQVNNSKHADMAKKRNGTSRTADQNESKTAKRPHLEENEVSKFLEEDSHLFNFIEMPEESVLDDANANKNSLSLPTKNNSKKYNEKLSFNSIKNNEIALKSGSIDFNGQVPKCDSLKNNINSKVADLRTVCESVESEPNDDEYSIPGSPICSTQVRRIRNVFKRCFDATFDPRSQHQAILARDSDSDE